VKKKKSRNLLKLLNS